MIYQEKLLAIKNGTLPKECVAKPKKPLKKISDKRAEEMRAEKMVRGEDETMKEKWFKSRRKEMVGVCQCGCGEPSQKNDNMWFRSSICHIFPQRLFPSVQFHGLNWVERRFWGGCHSNMDNKSMTLWPQMADWDDIKEKFYQLDTILTEEEKKQKFYTSLRTLVYKK